MDTSKTPRVRIDDLLRESRSSRTPIRRTTPTTQIMPPTTTALPAARDMLSILKADTLKPLKSVAPVSEFARAKAKRERMLKSMNDYSQPAPETVERAEQHAAMLASGQTIDEYYSTAGEKKAPGVKPTTTTRPELVDREVVVNHARDSEYAYLEFVRKTAEMNIDKIDDAEDLALGKATKDRIIKAKNIRSLSTQKVPDSPVTSAASKSSNISKSITLLSPCAKTKSVNLDFNGPSSSPQDPTESKDDPTEPNEETNTPKKEN